MVSNFKELLDDALDSSNLFYILWGVCLFLVSPTLYRAIEGLVGIDAKDDLVSSLLSLFFLLELALVYGVLSSKKVRSPQILANLSLICFGIVFLVCRIIFQ